MSFTATFVSAVCVLLPIKLRWQRNVKEIEYLRYSLKVIQLLFQRNTLILKTKIKPEWEKLSTYPLVKEVSFSTSWPSEINMKNSCTIPEKVNHRNRTITGNFLQAKSMCFLFVITCSITYGRSSTRLKKSYMHDMVRVYAETIKSLKTYNFGCNNCTCCWFKYQFLAF